MMQLAVTVVLIGTGVVVLALAVACWLTLKSARRRALAALATLALAPLVLVATVTGDQGAGLPTVSTPVALALGSAGLIVLALVAAVFVRFPQAVLPAALLSLPFRVPLAVGGESVKLLLPLYLVIAAATVAYSFESWRGGESGGTAARPWTPRWLDVAIAVFIVLYGVQALYAHDIVVAAQNMAFFYAPFTLLYGLAAMQQWTARRLRVCMLLVVALALLLVAAGFVEFASGKYLVRPGGIEPNDFDPYFRIQSLFFDPNIFGRFVSLAMIVLAAVLLFTGHARRVLASAAALAVLWVGLVLTLSQSSFMALLAGLIALACLRWRTKIVLLSAVAATVAVAIFVLAFPSVSSVDISSERSAETSTSGRFDLINGGLKLFADRPLWGYGSGGFADAFESRRLANDSAFGSPDTSKSHTSPLTVAAEQGLIGLLAFAALLTAAFSAVYRRVRPGAAVPAAPGSESGSAPAPGSRPGAVGRIAVAAAFTAIFAHSLTYAALLEDPLTWALLGIAVSLAAIPRTQWKFSDGDSSPTIEARPIGSSAPRSIGEWAT